MNNFLEKNRNYLSHHRCSISHHKNMLQAWVAIAFGYYAYICLKENIIASNNFRMAIYGILCCIFAFITANNLPSFLSPCWSLFAPLFGPLGWILLAKSIQDWRILEFFNYWGINSLNLMVTHYSIVLVVFTISLKKAWSNLLMETLHFTVSLHLSRSSIYWFSLSINTLNLR